MNKSKFKFIFDDSGVALVDAADFRDGAILAIGNRIRSGKSRSICGAWAQDGDAWKHIAQDTVTINLAAK